jgi:hypothetical protein
MSHRFIAPRKLSAAEHLLQRNAHDTVQTCAADFPKATAKERQYILLNTAP